MNATDFDLVLDQAEASLWIQVERILPNVASRGKPRDPSMALQSEARVWLREWLDRNDENPNATLNVAGMQIDDGKGGIATDIPMKTAADFDPNHKDFLEHVALAAEEAFWARVVEMRPDIKTGDFPPDLSIQMTLTIQDRLQELMEHAAKMDADDRPENQAQTRRPRP